VVGVQETNLRRELAILTVLGGEEAEEFEFGLVGAAAPVRDFKGELVAALNVSAPKFRLDRKLEGAGQEVKRAAEDLSALLGWSSDPLRDAGDSSGDGTVRRSRKREEGEM
jgi:Bacterial transcriptional regulator